MKSLTDKKRNAFLVRGILAYQSMKRKEIKEKNINYYIQIFMKNLWEMAIKQIIMYIHFLIVT